MSAQHTPGPWQVRVNGVYLRVVHGEHKTTVADSIVSETNARLIAAAPDMLEALRSLNAGARPCNWDDPDLDPGEADAWRQLDAAIAKATGEA